MATNIENFTLFVSGLSNQAVPSNATLTKMGDAILRKIPDDVIFAAFGVNKASLTNPQRAAACMSYLREHYKKLLRQNGEANALATAQATIVQAGDDDANLIPD